MHNAGDNPLLQALGVLVAADPERGNAIVKRAIASLVSDDTRKMGRPSSKDAAGWTQIRNRLRAQMEQRGVNCEDLAHELDLSVSATQKATAPGGDPPSPATIAKVEVWLSGRGANGRSADSSVNGDAASGLHLSQLEKDKLGGYLSFGDREIRNLLGVTKEIAEKAYRGQSLAPEIVTRIAQALEGTGAG
jgi:hypothetical protein